MRRGIEFDSGLSSVLPALNSGDGIAIPVYSEIINKFCASLGHSHDAVIYYRTRTWVSESFSCSSFHYVILKHLNNSCNKKISLQQFLLKNLSNKDCQCDN